MSKVTDQVPFRVPATAKSKAGEVFDPRKDLWKFSSSSKIILIHYEPLLTWATHAFVDSLKASMSVEARRVKAGTLLITVTAGVEPLLKHAHAQNGDFVDHITLDMVQAFKLSLDDRRLYQFEWVKVLGRILINHGDPAHGMDTQAAIWANSQRLPSRQRSKAVLNWDPFSGPLLPSEDRILMTALHASFEAAEISMHFYVNILLFRLSGMRPSQIADLKCKDLIRREGVYYLSFPQAKKQGEGWRKSFERWALVPEIGGLLTGFIAQEKRRWSHLGMEDELPMFVNKSNPDPLRPYHYSAASLVTTFPRRLANLRAPDPRTRKFVQIISPRTQKPFTITMKRFRISLATWALARGATLLEVAKILGHTSVSNALNSYVAIDPEILEEMDRKMVTSEVRTAGYFRGELVEEAHCTAGANLYPESFYGRAVGKCKSLCAQRKPYACYPCSQFQALMEGAHEQVLLDLEAEQEQIIASGGTYQVETLEMAKTAVKQVIAMRDDRLRRDGLTLANLLNDGS